MCSSWGFSSTVRKSVGVDVSPRELRSGKTNMYNTTNCYEEELSYDQVLENIWVEFWGAIDDDERRKVIKAARELDGRVADKMVEQMYA